MKYRIKVIEKNSGEKLFTPQYLKWNWYIKLVLHIIFSPFVLFLWLIIGEKKEWKDISAYFDMWNDINHNRETLKYNGFSWIRQPNTVCYDAESAELVIKNHKKYIDDENIRKYDEKRKAEMAKTKKTSYIKIND